MECTAWCFAAELTQKQRTWFRHMQKLCRSGTLSPRINHHHNQEKSRKHEIRWNYYLCRETPERLFSFHLHHIRHGIMAASYFCYCPSVNQRLLFYTLFYGVCVSFRTHSIMSVTEEEYACLSSRIFCFITRHRQVTNN